MTVVLFDLDDTLFMHSEAVEHGVLHHRRSHVGAMAAADDRAEFARWRELEEHHYHRYLSGELEFIEQRRARARDFVSPYGIDLAGDSAVDAWFGRYLGHYRAAWSLHDDVDPSLSSLRMRFPGLRVGVITNAALSFQLEKIDTIGLTPHLEHVIASGEVGVAKPDARIFEHAASVFATGVGECVYVGDRLETDAVGASRAGMRGVWLLRGRTASVDETRTAAESGVDIIRSLTELPALLGRSR